MQFSILLVALLGITVQLITAKIVRFRDFNKLKPSIISEDQVYKVKNMAESKSDSFSFNVGSYGDAKANSLSDSQNVSKLHQSFENKPKKLETDERDDIFDDMFDDKSE